MVDIAERLATPEQAIMLKKLGVQQKTQYAWFQDKDKEWKVCFDDEQGTIVDWTEDGDGYYAAHDLTDLGILLKSLGFYISGPVFYVDDESVDSKKIFWADDINSITEFNNDVYKAYGATEAEAKAALLIYLIEKGTVPAQWSYFIVDKLAAIGNLVGKEVYGRKLK